MKSIFKLLTSEQWEEAKITGIIPRCSADEKHDCVHINQFEDLNQVCAKFYPPERYPVALEFAPDSYPEEVDWLSATEKTPWQDGRLKISHLHADLVLNVYSFEYQQTPTGVVCRLQGDS